MNTLNWLSDRAFTAFAITALACCLNLLFLWMYSAKTRAGTKTAANEEDAAKFGSTYTPTDPPAVARVLRAHSNAQAIIVPFLLLGLTYVLSGGVSPGFVAWLFGIFAVARWLHSICYLGGLQPWRTVFFLVSVACLVVLMGALGWRLV